MLVSSAQVPNRVLDELPAGLVEEGETPKAAVKRELREETGYKAKYIIPLGARPAGAYTTRTTYHFLALGCTQTGQQELGEQEFIEVVTKSVQEVLSGAVSTGYREKDGTIPIANMVDVVTVLLAKYHCASHSYLSDQKEMSEIDSILCSLHNSHFN